MAKTNESTPTRTVIAIVTLTILLAGTLVTCVLAFSKVDSKADYNCTAIKKIEKANAGRDEVITQVRIQQGKTDTKLDAIAEGVARIEKRMDPPK